MGIFKGDTQPPYSDNLIYFTKRNEAAGKNLEEGPGSIQKRNRSGMTWTKENMANEYFYKLHQRFHLIGKNGRQLLLKEYFDLWLHGNDYNLEIEMLKDIIKVLDSEEHIKINHE